MAGLPGPELDEGTKRLIDCYKVNNFILFTRNLSKGPKQARLLIQDIQKRCVDSGLPLPLIAADQEGGPVQRLAPPLWPRLASNREAGSWETPEDAVIEQARQAAEVLLDVGINVNLAPVLDLSFSGQDDVLAQRCYSNDASLAARLGAIYINTLQSHSLAATAKHFPGIGRTRQDPHLKRPVIQADAETIISEAYPFEKAVEAGVAAVMTSHLLYTALDARNIATFSKEIAGVLLRGVFGFKGVLFTDDLEMGGITEHFSVPNAAVKALSAGHDMLLICHDQSLVQKSILAIEKAVEDDELTEERLLESAHRINQMRLFVQGGGG